MGQMFVNILFHFSLTCLVALSFFVYFKASKYFHLSHAVVILGGAYTAVWISKNFVGFAWIAIPASILSGALLGYVINRLYELIPESKSKSIEILVFSLGLMVIAQNLLAIVFEERILRASLCSACEGVISSWNISISYNQVIITNIAFLVGVCCLWLWYSTKFGLRCRALSESPDLCSVIGMDVERQIRFLSVLSGALAGLTGALTAFDIGITPNAGLTILMPGIIAVIAGGNRTMLSTFAGAMFVSLIIVGSNYIFSSKWAVIPLYVLLIFLLAFRPEGLVSLKRRLGG